MTNCHSLKDALVQYLSREIEVTDLRDSCVLTLPSKTLDERFPDIFVERKLDGYFLVHDAGKTTSELFAQGIHLTEAREQILTEMARKLGVVFAEGMFQVGCNGAELQQAIIAVGQCATMGMWQVLTHKPDFAEEPVVSRVERALESWTSPYPQSLRSRVTIKGRKTNHTFDFVSFPEEPSHKTIGVKVLKPSENPKWQAERYGFFVYDIERTMFEEWLRFAVLTKSDQWTKDAKDLVRRLSTGTLEIETGKEDEIERLVPSYMLQLAA